MIPNAMNAGQWIGYILAVGFALGMIYAIVVEIIYRPK